MKVKMKNILISMLVIAGFFLTPVEALNINIERENTTFNKDLYTIDIDISTIKNGIAINDINYKLPTSSTKVTWNSVALFFNLKNPSERPLDYTATTAQDAKNWLDEGTNPANPTISDFMYNYWNTLSYGHLAFRIDTPRSSYGTPLIPNLDAPGGNPDDWGGLIVGCINANPEAVWNAAGGLTKDSKRWIPSVVLIQHYNTWASAGFSGWEQTVGGKTYLIGDVTHISYDLSWFNYNDLPWNSVRAFWGHPLCHEYCHNFLEFGDLYGPQGCTGYWDNLGDNLDAGRMSEVCSPIKARIGWLNYKHVIYGPIFTRTSFELRPYTTSSDAIKIVPDPEHNPYEYFVLEYRKSTGNEPWRPDGALQEEGLLILHINERMNPSEQWVSPVWLMRDAPYFDPEFADFSDNGGTLWTGVDKMNGVLFTGESGKNKFSTITRPNSKFYGGRNSDLTIDNIRIEDGKCKFRIRILGDPRIGWIVGPNDRCLVGRFTPTSINGGGQEILIRNYNSLALLDYRQAQWLVTTRRQNNWVGFWHLGSDNHEVVGDFDGDGMDEIYIRSPQWAAILKYYFGFFTTKTIKYGRVGDWTLNTTNWESAGDFDGDGKDEIYIRSPHWAGILKLVDNRLQSLSVQYGKIGDWSLGGNDQEFIGRFTQTKKDEILIVNKQWLGLLYWDDTLKKLCLKSIQYDWAGNWNIGDNDKYCIADLLGNDRDEIYVRSATWVGVLTWRSDQNQFSCTWLRETDLEHMDGDSSHKILLQSDDISYSGHFLPDRDGILHRTDNGVAILAWHNSQICIRQYLPSRFNDQWNLGSVDKFVLGDFHNDGPDVGDPSIDYITDGLTDIFIYNTWGTGMVGVNYVEGFGDIHEEIGLTWINPTEILYRSSWM